MGVKGGKKKKSQATRGERGGNTFLHINTGRERGGGSQRGLQKGAFYPEGTCYPGKKGAGKKKLPFSHLREKRGGAE